MFSLGHAPFPDEEHNQRKSFSLWTLLDTLPLQISRPSPKSSSPIHVDLALSNLNLKFSEIDLPVSPSSSQDNYMANFDDGALLDEVRVSNQAEILASSRDANLSLFRILNAINSSPFFMGQSRATDCTEGWIRDPVTDKCVVGSLLIGFKERQPVESMKYFLSLMDGWMDGWINFLKSRSCS